MPVKLKIEEFHKLAGHMPLIDVRSPSEFKKGHIPGAINIPLFTDDERRIVGTLYVRVSREAAIAKGFEFLASRFGSLLDSVPGGASESGLSVYCWRGGMRSGAMAWLFERNHINCHILEGGYKSYRRYLRNYFIRDFKLKLIGGKTGSGKTEILKELGARGFQVIDLEGIARHKGSSFGSLGEENQPSNEHFENLLFEALFKLDRGLPIWLEDESRNIGKVFIPPEIFLQMKKSRIYVADMEKSLRVKRLVRDYSGFPDEELISGIQRISSKLGGKRTAEAIEAIALGNYSLAVEISLDYYDKTYSFGLDKRDPELKTIFECPTVSASENTDCLIRTALLD